MEPDDPFGDLIPASQAGRTGYIPGTPKPPQAPSGYRSDGRGGFEIIPGGPADPYRPGGEYDPKKPPSAKDEKPSATEQTAAFLATRVAGGIKDITAELQAHPDSLKPSVRSAVAGVFGETARNYANPAPRRNIEAAQLDVLDAALTLGTGAAYNKEQLEAYRQAYFPQLGDDEHTIKGKEVRLRRLLEAAKLKSGASAPMIDQALAAIGGEAPAPAGRYKASNGQVILNDDSAYAGVAARAHTVDNPQLAGVNAKLNAMVKRGANAQQIAAFLTASGIPPQEVMPSALKVLKFRKDNPNYKGDYFVNVDDKIVPNSGFQDFAAGPIGAAGIAAGDTVSGGHLDNAVGLGGGNADLANIGIAQSREAHPYASMAGDIAAGASLYGAGGAAARGMGLAGEGPVAAFAPRALAGDAALGAYVSSGQGGTQIADPQSMALGGLLGAATGAGVRGTLNTAGAAISPTGGALAPIYEAGGRPTVGQRLGASNNIFGRMANRAEQAFGSVPILGGVQRGARNAAVGEMQTGAFNDALGEIGLRLPKGIKKGAAAHKFMQRAFDDIYDRARSRMRFAPDDGLEQAINDIAPEASLLTSQSQSILKKISDDIGAKLDASGGELSGDQYKLVVSRLGNKIGSLRSSPSGDHELAGVLERFQAAIEDAARRNSDPEAVALLDAADKGYAKAVIIETAGKARGGEMGEFNGTQLDAAVQRSDKSRRSRAYLRGEARMQEYAAAAKKLGDELPDSGTGERVATMAAAGGAAHFISPYALAPWAVDTLANLPGVRQTLGALMAPRPQNVRPMTDAARRFLENTGRYAPSLAIPVAE